MIDVAEVEAGVEVWMDLEGCWVRLSQAETRLAALVDAEHVIRDNLGELQEQLAEAKQQERARLGGRGPGGG